MTKQKPMDILSLIEEDHERVNQLFEEIETTEGKKRIQSFFNQIYKELTLHAKVEELVFYPAMREFEETSQYLEEAEKEHNSVKILLEQMKSLEVDDPEFETQLMHLRESVLHHVEEEESEIFSAVRECMEAEDLQSLGEEFQQSKKRLEPDVEAMLSRT